MWWVAGRVRRDDGGAVLVIMTICLSVVLLGVAAIGLNTGSWYAENAQLQNGADAAALSIAEACTSTAGCPQAILNDQGAPVTQSAVDLADRNANDNAAHVDYVCGNAVGLSPCDSSIPGWTATGCPKIQAAADGSLPGYVNVHTSTENADGSNSLPVIGGLTGKGEHIKSCAQVVWGPASFDGGVAITLSYCDWQTATANGFADPPPWPPYPTTNEVVLQLKGVTDTSCPHGPSGGTPIPSGFGRLDPNGTDPCTSAVTGDGWYDQSSGNGNSDQWVTECKGVIANYYQFRTVVFIPIFDGVRLSGNNGQYHLNNMAAFVITAYYIQNGNISAYSTIPNSPYVAANYGGNNRLCGGNTCLIGYFVTGQDPTAPPGVGGLNGGVIVPPRLNG